jgi:UDP-glucose 4-epimerase
MRVFITGGAGFIGSHLVDHYLANGHQVTVLDNLSTGNLRNLAHWKDQIEIITGDIRSLDLVDSQIKKSDLILHMAAALGVNTILESTVESVSTNFTGSEVVLQSALKHQKRIMIASTSEIYGKNPKQPLTETDDRVVGAPQKIRWTYSDAKALEEAVAHSLFLEKSLAVTTVRFFNTVGPRQTGRYGMVVPRFVKAALENKTLQIYGDGNQSRVFCHVLDAVSAVTQLIETEKSIGEVFNVGGIGEVTIKELAEKVITLTKSNSKTEFVPYELAYARGYEDMQRRIPDITKVSNFLNWKPERFLPEIIADVASSI